MRADRAGRPSGTLLVTTRLPGVSSCGYRPASTRCWPRRNMLAAARTRLRRGGTYLRGAARRRVASAV